jgi:hypothetical protein
MIDLLLKAIDRLMDVVRIREKRTRFRYDEVYKPAYAELLSVHSDYLSMFHGFASALKAIPDGATESDKHAQAALDLLRERRIAFAPVRQKLVAFDSLVVGDNAIRLPKVERDFLRSLTGYFFLGELFNPYKRETAADTPFVQVEYMRSAATNLVEKLEAALCGWPPNREGAQPRNWSLEDVRRACDVTTSQLVDSWMIVTEDFNRLRFEVMRQTS